MMMMMIVSKKEFLQCRFLTVSDSFNEGACDADDHSQERCFSIRVSNNFNERLKTTIMTEMMAIIYTEGTTFVQLWVSDSFDEGLDNHIIK
jgi:hypothetical protein